MGMMGECCRGWCVYHAVGTDVRFLDVLGLFGVVLADDLNPVGVWVEGEGNVSHPSIR